MTQLSHNLALDELSEFQPGFENSNQGFDFERIARKALWGLASPKEWADALKVSQQLIRNWRNGERIPVDRQKEIILKAQPFRKDNRDLDEELAKAIHQMLAEAYGPAGKDSM